MKHFLPVLASFLMYACVATPAFAQQTPINTVCNEKSGLSWEMNKELDVDHYTIYVANGPGIANANPPVLPLAEVPHDPATAVIQPDGSKEIGFTLAVTMSEGDKFFTVTASDKSGNTSPHSNEVGCQYNTTPSAPNIRFLFVQPKS